MLNSLLQPHPRPLLILKTTYIKRERARLLLYLREHATRVLHLELVRHVRVPLVDRSPRLLHPGLAVLTRRYQYIDPVHLVLTERSNLKVPFSRVAWVQDNPFLAVDDVLGLLTG
jgi:hypothetical protein